jgi:hypothetical protein
VAMWVNLLFSATSPCFRSREREMRWIPL